MNKAILSPKPAQADDCEKEVPQTSTDTDKPESTNTGGRKTLSLWSTNA